MMLKNEGGEDYIGMSLVVFPYNETSKLFFKAVVPICYPFCVWYLTSTGKNNSYPLSR